MKSRSLPEAPAILYYLAAAYLLARRWFKRQYIPWLVSLRPRHLLLPGALSQVGVMLYNIHTNFADLFPSLWLVLITFGLVTLRAQARLSTRVHYIGY